MNLKIEDVNKSYNKLNILNQISFSIYSGQYVALLGNNGVGKTTLFKIICGLTSFDSGKIQLSGKPIKSLDSWQRKDLGIIFSDFYLVEEFTVVEYLRFTGRFHGLDKSKTEVGLEEMIRNFNIIELSNRKIKELSTGNKRRVSLAASLIHNPGLLLLDEPFLGLDINATSNLVGKLLKIKGGKSLLISSHDLNLISELCDVFLYLDERGILHAPIKKEDFKDNDALNYFLKTEKHQIDFSK